MGDPEVMEAPDQSQTVDSQDPGSDCEQAVIPSSERRLSDIAALEAILFMAAEPISAAELAEILDVTPAGADQLCRELAAVFEGRGVQIARVAGGYQVATRPEYGPYVAKLHKPERFRLSRAALETLAIIAYKQPVTRPEVEAVRGVNSDSAIDTLTQYQLVCEAGRKEAPGRPVLYRTTDSFLGHFGLNSVDDLPRIDSIPADEESVRAEVEQALGSGSQESQQAAVTEEPPSDSPDLSAVEGSAPLPSDQEQAG
ncbi:MAG: SMC-Scp complex subunit ScpB [Armatimonadota bacterium]